MKGKTNKTIYQITAALAIVALTLNSLSAEQPANTNQTENPLKIDEIIVLGTKIPSKAKDITSSVTTIDPEQIQSSPSDYVLDVINYAPGVYVRRDAIYGRQDVSIRGLGSNLRRIQTLIDGRPEKMSLFGCTVSQTIPLANVERIEVLRGPESVLYGSDAMGGVINVVTRKRATEGFEGEGLVEYGSYDTFHSLLRQGGKVEKLDYYATYDYKQSDGHRENSKYSANFGSLRLGYVLNDEWQIKATGQGFSDLANDPGPVNKPYTNNDRRKYDRASFDISLKKETSEDRFEIIGYNNIGEHKFSMPTISDYWHSKDLTLGTRVDYLWTIYEDDKMHIKPDVGYEYQYLWAKPQSDWVDWAKKNMPAKFMDFGSYEQHNNDVFVFNETRYLKFANTIGLRLHYDDVSKEVEPLPHIGALYHLTDSTTLRAKAARGFRQPRFSELYLFPAHNEKLDPEEVWGYDFGLIQKFDKYASIEVAPFYQKVDNMVQTVPNPNPPPQAINQNSGSFDIKGIEVNGELKPIDILSFVASYTYTDIEDADGSDKNANRAGVPENKISISGELKIAKLKLSMEWFYVAGLYDTSIISGAPIEKVPDYYVVNAKGAYEIFKYAELFAGIDNLFDRDYEQIPGYPMPGITVYGGLRVALR